MHLLPHLQFQLTTPPKTKMEPKKYRWIDTLMFLFILGDDVQVPAVSFGNKKCQVSSMGPFICEGASTLGLSALAPGRSVSFNRFVAS